jgi:hypothetical protein
MSSSPFRRSLKVMADYHCFPLWESDPDLIGNVDPSTLPISDSLRAKLLAWAASFDATLVRDDPVSSGFSSPAAEKAWLREGAQLAEVLRDELGPMFTVTYWHASQLL